MNSESLLQLVAQKKRSLQIWLATSLSALLLLATGLGWFTWSLHNEVASLASRAQTAQQEYTVAQSVQQTYQQARRRYDAQQTFLQQIKELQGSWQLYKNSLEAIANVIPNDVYITRYKQDDTSLELQGYGAAYQTINNFVQKLNTLRTSPVTIASLSTAQESGALPYTFTLTTN